MTVQRLSNSCSEMTAHCYKYLVKRFLVVLEVLEDPVHQCLLVLADPWLLVLPQVLQILALRFFPVVLVVLHFHSDLGYRVVLGNLFHHVGPVAQPVLDHLECLVDLQVQKHFVVTRVRRVTYVGKIKCNVRYKI